MVDTGGTDMIDLQVKLTEKVYQKYGNALNMDDCSDLAEDILYACNANTDYEVPLKEWMNGKNYFHDYAVHDFSLVELASRLNPKHPNIPVAILILYLEGQEYSGYRGLSAIADQGCICDSELLNGQPCKYAIKEDGNWYFLLTDKRNVILKECQMWQVLLLNPKLILQAAYDHPDNTALILQEDGGYLIVYDADRKE